MADTPLPSLPFSSLITPDKHGAQVVVIAILGLIANILVFTNRLFLRWPWKQRFGTDDWVCLIATALAAAQTGVILGAVAHGLGTKAHMLTPMQIEVIEKLVYASKILFVSTLCMSKLAVGCLFRRLSQRPGTKAIILGICIYGIVGILIVAVGRKIATPWKVANNSFRPTLVRFMVVEALGMLFDVALTVYPAVLIRGLRMKRSTKIAVFLGFALRFPVFIFAVLRIAYLAALDLDQFMFSYVNAEIFGQAEMHYNVVAATIPCLRLFLKGWNTNFMHTTLQEMDPDAYTRHSFVTCPTSSGACPKSKASSSCPSNKLSWHSRTQSQNQVWDGNHCIEYRISAEHVRGPCQVSAGSSRSIIVHHSIDVDVT